MLSLTIVVDRPLFSAIAIFVHVSFITFFGDPTESSLGSCSVSIDPRKDGKIILLCRSHSTLSPNFTFSLALIL